MRQIKTIILTILAFVFCVQAKMVVDTCYYTGISYNSNGEITSKTESIWKYGYDANGQFNEITFFIKNSENIFYNNAHHEYDTNGNFRRTINYDSNGNIMFERRFNTTTTTVNSMTLIKVQEYENYDADGKILNKYKNEYEYNSYGDTILFNMKHYDADGNLQRETKVIYEYEYNSDDNTYILRKSSTNPFYYKRAFATINSKRLITSSITYDSGDNKRQQQEYEYNDNGLQTKTINYDRDDIKTSEITYTYVYKELNPTTINRKQKVEPKNSFQVSKSTNSLSLNFIDNSARKIEIINLQGKILKSQNFSAKIHNINIENLPKNVYVLRIFENGKINSVKFVKE